MVRDKLRLAAEGLPSGAARLMQLGLLLCLVPLPLGCDRAIRSADATTKVDPAIPVRLAHIARGSIDRPLRASGLVR